MAALALGVVALTALVRAPSSAADPAIDSTESQFLTLINDYRQQNGVGALVINVDLSEAADWYVTDMTTKNYFGTKEYCAKFVPPLPAHCDSYGGMPQHRISAFGYGPASISENAAAGFSTAQAVFNAWKGSPGHNSNMLRSSWKSIGIAWACKAGTTFGCYWVTDFGSIIAPPNPNLPYPAVLGTPTPTATPTPSSTPIRTPTATPSPSPAPSPSPTPTPYGLAWEDLNCDTAVLPQDAVTLLMVNAGLDSDSGPAGVPANCPTLGESVIVDGVSRVWGDIDCSGAINAIDSVKLLRWLIGLPVTSSDPTCPDPGDPF